MVARLGQCTCDAEGFVHHSVRAKVNKVGSYGTVNTNHRRLFVVSEEAAANNNADAELLHVCLLTSKLTINQAAYSLSLVFTLFSLYEYAYR